MRIVAVLVLAFTFSALHGAAALTLMGLLTVALVAVSGTRPAALLRALRLPGLVVAGLVVLLPLTSGDTILTSLGPLHLRAEGLAAATVIALRFLCIFALVATFLGALPVAQLIAGLRGLHLPALLVDMALLSLRHIADLRHDLTRMQTAMRLRGGYPRWRDRISGTGWILASLLLRSHARSERIYHAMILRGHGAPEAALPALPKVTGSDKAALLALIALAAGLLAVEHLA